MALPGEAAGSVGRSSAGRSWAPIAKEHRLSTETTPITRAAAGYRPGAGYRRCWNCQSFTLPQVPGPGAEDPAPGGLDTPPPATCAVLQGPVEPTAVCDRWAQMADRAKKRTGFRSALRRHGGEYLWDEKGEAGGPGEAGPPGSGTGSRGSDGTGGGPVGL